MILIIPDIHGRTFWKKPCENIDKYEHVVFLGDYTDTYPYENISKEETIYNFVEILDFKKKNNDKVILLLGNHDISYFMPNEIKVRYDYENESFIKSLFLENYELFSLAFEKMVNGKKYIFSHAGITKEWINSIVDFSELKPYKEDDETIDENKIVFILNELLKDNKVSNILRNRGPLRGGYHYCGSCVWNDVREHSTLTNISDAYQIFGHTQLIEQPIIRDTFADLDCRKAFILTDEGGIFELKE